MRVAVTGHPSHGSKQGQFKHSAPTSGVTANHVPTTDEGYGVQAARQQQDEPIGPKPADRPNAMSVSRPRLVQKPKLAFLYLVVVDCLHGAKRIQPSK